MVSVVFDQVSKSFGDMVTIPCLDLVIEAGEFVSLLGPSGCGKTTTLRMLAGLERPTSGSIRIGDRDVVNLAPAARDIAMVFQSYALYPHMTVAENICYPLRKRGVAKAERATALARTAELLQLEALLDRKPKQLSGGQQQRVALGRALVRDPSVFLLDEPLSNLDAKLRAHMRAELIELHRRLGKTTVYVTHDQLEAMTMSTRVAIMKDGVLQQYGPPAEIYARPANSFVAGFIGTPPMALVEGRLGSDGVVASLAIGALAVELPDLAPELAPRGVLAGIRPEDVLIGSGPWQGDVRLAEHTGHETIVTLDAGGNVPLTARMAGGTAIRAGDRVPFDLRRGRIHLFDAQGGQRLDLPTRVPAAPAAPEIARS